MQICLTPLLTRPRRPFTGAEGSRGGQDQSPPQKGDVMLGKLNWAAIPLDQPIPLMTSLVVIVAVIATLSWITAKIIGHIFGASGLPPSITNVSA